MQETVVEKECAVGAAAFYETLLLSAAAELSEATGSEKSPADLKEGFHYRREGKEGRETVTFRRLRPDREYAVKVARGTKNIQIRFEITGKAGGSCLVRMSQTVMTNKKPDRISDTVMKMRMKKKISDLEKGTKRRLKDGI